jgi:hypothetical protein
MTRLTSTLMRARRVASARPEGGDVPGWVFITIMTAGIVMAIWAFAGPQLLTMITNAINSVTGP